MTDPKLMRLKLIAQVDFRKNEHTNYLEQALAKQGKKSRKKFALKPGEVVCLVSSSGNQIVFVYNPGSVTDGHADFSVERKVLHSERLRLTSGGRWNPMMLANYAREVGIKLEGIKSFEEHYARMGDERRRLRRLRAAS
jgi:hypothetical protein